MADESPESEGSQRRTPQGWPSQGVVTPARIKQILAGLGMSRAGTLDLPAAWAATTTLEAPAKGGTVDPQALGDTTLADGPSVGAWQVLRAAHPDVFQDVLEIVQAPITAEESIRRQAMKVAPAMKDAMAAASSALALLKQRGAEITEDLAVGLIDAAHNHGGLWVLKWAATAPTTAILEALAASHARLRQCLDAYHALRGLADDAEGLGEFLAVVVVGLGLAWALGKM